MIDKFGRKINYLRISITERCNLKCIYCFSVCENQNVEYREQLSPKEFEKIVKVMAEFGVEHVRLTGGEPLVREDISEIVERISFIGIPDISISTNGIRLKEMAHDLKKAGINRVNISLDSLNDERIKKVTGQYCLDRVKESIEKSLEVGISPLRINIVLMKGINDDEIADFIDLARKMPVDVRFIELMPMSSFGEENRDRIIYNSEILKMYPKLKRIRSLIENGPATYYTMDGLKGNIGFISSISHQFCHLCNRIRLTADGKIRPCLGENGEIDIVPALSQSYEFLRSKIEESIYCKPKGHNFQNDFISERKMFKIGG